MNFKYKQTFSSFLKPVVSEDKDKYLALASLADVGKFIPDVNVGKNVDLLPVAFNAAVVNRVNKNGDVIDTNIALASYKNFVNKQINLEHNREKIIGVILAAGFSEFGTDKPLTEEEVKTLTKPFNIILGGVIWKIANPGLADLIEDSGDSTSNNYQRISASWELGFNDYSIIEIVGDSKNIEDGTEITDEVKIKEMSSSLRSLGGSGKLDKNKFVYRKVIGNMVPLGIGLTESPAADVKGVATKVEPEMANSSEVLAEIISKPEILNVNKDNTKKVMTIKSRADITDANLKEATASQISDVIEQELKTASEKFAAEKVSVETQLTANKASLEKVTSAHAELEKKVVDLKAALEKVESEKNKIIANDKFNERMSAFDAEYDLDSDTRQVLAGDIKDMTDDSFAVYNKKMAVFLKNKKKGKPGDKSVDNSDTKQDKLNGDGSTKASVEAVAQVVEDVTANAGKEKIAIANTSNAAATSSFDKYKNAFGFDGFVVTNK